MLLHYLAILSSGSVQQPREHISSGSQHKQRPHFFSRNSLLFDIVFHIGELKPVDTLHLWLPLDKQLSRTSRRKKSSAPQDARVEEELALVKWVVI